MSSKWFSFLDRKKDDAKNEGSEEEETRGERLEKTQAGAGVDGSVRMLQIKIIDTNPYQPRQSFADDTLQELAESISRYGVLQPIVVRPNGERYELIVGERRLRAARMAGLEAVPAVVREASQEEVALLALVENLQRQDLGFFEEAGAYERLLVEFDLTQSALAERLGKSQSTIANKLRLLRLPEAVKVAVDDAGLSERHARALLQLECEAEQLRVIERVVEEQLSVRETDRLVKERAAGEEDKPQAKRFVKVYKDLRLFINSFRELVSDLRETGVQARFEQEEQDGELVIRVRIPRPRGGVEQ